MRSGSLKALHGLGPPDRTTFNTEATMGLKKVVDVLDEVSKTSSRNEKLRLLTDLKDGSTVDSEILWSLFSIAYDPYRIFNLNWHPTESDYKGGPDFDWSNSERQIWSDFLYTVKMAESGDHPVSVTKDRLQILSSQLPYSVSSRLAEIFCKALRVGVGAATVEHLYPGRISWFACQLAGQYSEGKVDGPYWYAEPKIDGLRSLFIIDGSDVKALSRNGKPLGNVDHISEALMETWTQICHRSNGIVIDGELIDEDWASSVSLARSHDTVAKTGKLKLVAFDMIDKGLFEKCAPTESYTSRRNELWFLLESCYKRDSVTESFLIKNLGRLVSNHEDVMTMTSKYVSEGYEGSVVKNGRASYQYGRTGDWLKSKVLHTADYKVVDIDEGAGRLAGTMGALWVDADGVSTKVGTGFSDADRDHFWQLSREGRLEGTVVELMYQEKTPTGRLRFPVFVKERIDK